MSKTTSKLTLALFLFFLLDLIKPLGYPLSVEFLFLGIIFIALHQKPALSLILAILFGYFKDSFIYDANPLSVIGFVFICLLIQLLRIHFIAVVRKAYYNHAKAVTIAIAIIAYIIFNSICSKTILPLFSVSFFIQSFLLSLLLNYLMQKWTVIYPPQTVSVKA